MGDRLAELDCNMGLFGFHGFSALMAAGQSYHRQTPESATGPYESADVADVIR